MAKITVPLKNSAVFDALNSNPLLEEPIFDNFKVKLTPEMTMQPAFIDFEVIDPSDPNLPEKCFLIGRTIERIIQNS